MEGFFLTSESRDGLKRPSNHPARARTSSKQSIFSGRGYNPPALPRICACRLTNNKMSQFPQDSATVILTKISQGRIAMRTNRMMDCSSENWPNEIGGNLFYFFSKTAFHGYTCAVTVLETKKNARVTCIAGGGGSSMRTTRPILRLRSPASDRGLSNETRFFSSRWQSWSLVMTCFLRRFLDVSDGRSNTIRKSNQRELHCAAAPRNKNFHTQNNHRRTFENVSTTYLASRLAWEVRAAVRASLIRGEFRCRPESFIVDGAGRASVSRFSRCFV